MLKEQPVHRAPSGSLDPQGPPVPWVTPESCIEWGRRESLGRGGDRDRQAWKGRTERRDSQDPKVFRARKETQGLWGLKGTEARLESLVLQDWKDRRDLQDLQVSAVLDSQVH